MKRADKIEMMHYYLDEAAQCSSRAAELMQELEKTKRPIKPVQVWENKIHYTSADKPHLIDHAAKLEHEAAAVADCIKQLLASLEHLQELQTT